MNIIGIDIGGTKCAAILGRTGADGSLSVIAKTTVQTKDYPDPYRMIRYLQDQTGQLLTEYGVAVIDVKAIGISCGGPLDSRSGMILSPPNLPGWDEIPIVRLFSERFGIQVALQNDANACALAEWLMGAGKGTSNMIFLTFGTGMGAGLIIDGKLYSGTNDMAGEVGHIRMADSGPSGYGKEGSFEGFCSGGGIAQLAKAIVADKLRENIPVGFCTSPEMIGRIDTRMVAISAEMGDPTALEIIKISAGHLGRGLSVLIDILNPECIVIGSIYQRNEKLFNSLMKDTLVKETLPLSLGVCSIKPAALGDDIGDYASLCVAINAERSEQK